MIVEVDGQYIPVPDGSTTVTLADGRVIPIDYDTDDRHAELEQKLAALEQRMDGQQRDAEHIERGLIAIEQQIGRELTPDEIQRLGSLAIEGRGPDGVPDIALMRDAATLQEALTEYEIAPEMQEEFVDHALANRNADGLPDVTGTIETFYDVVEEPKPLAPDASRAEVNEFIRARAEEIERDQRADRDQRAYERASLIAEGVDPGAPDPDMRSWERDGNLTPDTSDMSRSELAEYMADRVRELDAETANQAPEAA